MIGAILFLAAALSAGNADFDRAAAEGAARIVFARARQEFADRGLPEGVLKRAMLDDPGRFVERAEAEEVCRSIYVAEAERRYCERCAEVCRELSLPDTFAVAFSDADREALARGFTAAFADERDQAVAEQANGIVALTRPSEAEIESKDESVLRREMTERIAAEQGTPVFRENERYISEQIVDPVLASARNERKRQAGFLVRVRSEMVSPSKLTADLQSRLECNVAERRKKDGADAWGVFPSVLSVSLPQAVERRCVDRLAGYVENETVGVSSDDVLAVIAVNAAAHRKASDSAKLFRRYYAARIVALALEDAVRDAPEADRAELRSFLASRLETEAVAKAAEQTVRRDVMPKWKAARAEAAARQANEVWPRLGDGTWYPLPELADATVARSDYAESVKDWRRLEGMEELASAPHGRDLMEEALAQADAGVSAAFERARNAIAAQNAIVDEEHPKLSAKLRDERGGFFRSKPDVKEIAERLTTQTVARWSETREQTLWPDGNMPINAGEQHAALFPSVCRKIELIAKAILEELEKPQPEEPEPDVPKPEEPLEQQLQYSISVSRDGGKVEVKLFKGDAPVYEKSLDSKFAPFDAAMREVAEKLGRDLLKLK